MVRASRGKANKAVHFEQPREPPDPKYDLASTSTSEFQHQGQGQGSGMRKLRSCWSSLIASVVPSSSSTVQASPRHHRGGGAGGGVSGRRSGGGRLLAPSSVLAGQTGGRPHTLYLAPSSSANPDDTMENRGTLRKMAASFESIGSCSLDVDITASESSGLLDSRGGCGVSLSQRTLHSLDSQKLVAHSTEELSTPSSSRHYVKRAAKLFDPAEVSNSDESVFTPPRSRPSYVSLSCSVSGYSRATNYSSSRLRDPSPCSRQNGAPTPLPLTRPGSACRDGSSSRTSLPPTMNGHHAAADTVDCAAVRLNGRSSSPSSGDKVMQYSKQTFVSQMGPSSTYNETSSWHSSVNRSESNMSNGAAANTAKSFIQQRVERLYGRGALAQGFFRQTKLISNGDSSAHSKENNPLKARSEERTLSSFPELPVLRLLRPEFRDQLSISSPHSSPWWRNRQSPPRACNGNGISPDTSPREHIIPITLEAEPTGDVKEHPQPTAAAPETLQCKLELGKDMVSSISSGVSVCDVATQVQETPIDLQPAAPEVVIAVEPLIADSIKPPEADSNLKDGHYFLKLLGVECQRLLAMAEEVQVEYDATPDLPEEASGKLRAAIGQARLLVRQKLQQFEGLCHRNLAQSGEEQFPTTCDDLAGFWDMVQLQIAHVDALFEELGEMRKQGWQEVSPLKAGKNGTSKTRRSSAPKTAAAAPKLSEKAQEAARLRDEQRKKLMEERRRTAKLHKKTEAEAAAVEIFAPDSNSS